ncbi:unnamed protein product [Rotaria sordida]|uniref:Uncharacterized protein n=4 Tax=Rotaria sordida TaxID=392033 RepID=A0A814QLL1_9BILA|nr:unnamed protein product [Rotaria sordida]
MSLTNDIINAIYNTSAGGDSTPSTSGSGIGQYPSSESPQHTCNGNITDKHLNFGPCSSSTTATNCGLNTGFYITPQQGASLITGIKICTANDNSLRDPITITFEGSNSSGASRTIGSSWTLLYNGTSGLSVDPVGGPDQIRLLKYLLTDNQHRAIARPVQNDSDTLHVTINLALQNIIDFDEKNEAIVISGWLSIMWNDYSLRWKPEEFGNIQTLRIPSTQIWTPDILLYNSADENFDTTVKVNAVVQYNGDVLYVPPILYKTIRTFNIAAFPFVIPCFLISCMTILGFLLSPDSGEKLTLHVTTLLTVVMFSLLLSEILPPSSNAIPIITAYFICITIMSAVSVAVSVLILSLHFRNSTNHTMSLWVRKYICNYLAWVLHMKRPNHDLSWRGIRRRWASPQQESNNRNKSIDNHHSKIFSGPLLNNTFELLSTNVINIDKKPLESLENQEKQCSDSLLEFAVLPTKEIHSSHHHHQNTSKELYTCDMDMTRSELRIIISQLAILINYSRQKEQDDNECQDWQFVAMVIDRLCLVVFTTIMVLFTAHTFLNI